MNTSANLTIIPMSIRGRLEELAAMEPGEFTVAFAGKTLMLISPNIEAVLGVECVVRPSTGGVSPVIFDGVSSSELPLLAGAPCSQDGMFVEFAAPEGKLRYLISSESQERGRLPRPDAWKDVPFMDHIKGILPHAEVCWCDNRGNFCTVAAYTSAAVVPYLGGGGSPQCAITVRASLLLEVLKSGIWRKYCVLGDRLFFKREGEIVSLGHSVESAGLEASPLIDFCSAYRKIGEISITGAMSCYKSDVLRLSWKGGVGVIDVYGRIVGRFTCGIGEEFDISIAEGIEGLLAFRKFTIYVPDQPNQPVAFRNGNNWFWTMVLPIEC